MPQLAVDKPIMPPQPSSSPNNLEPKSPRLTMKFLHGMICELQRENALLSEQIRQLEKQLEQIEANSRETACAMETPITPEPEKRLTETEPDELEEPSILMKPKYRTDLPAAALLAPRSAKRTKDNNKQSFWSGLWTFFIPGTKKA